MSVSQQLRLIGGPIETINETMRGVEQSLSKSIADVGERAVRMAEIRQLVAQAVLDGYSAGRREPAPKPER